MRFRAILLLLASFSCWTDELVLVVAPSLSQECFDSTEDDEAVDLGRSPRSGTQLCQGKLAILARSTNQRQRNKRVVPTVRKQLTSFFPPSGPDERLVRYGGLYQLMSLQI